MRYALAWFLLLAACTDQGPIVPNAVPWSPLPVGEVDSLWRSVEACSGLTGDWHGIDFYVVLASTFPSPSGQSVVGLWDGKHSIYIAEPRYPTWQPWPHYVAHEMLHALTHSGAHGPAFDACGLR